MGRANNSPHPFNGIETIFRDRAKVEALLALLPPVLPHITVANGLDPRLISHDPDVVRDYLGDPRVHNRISPRLGRFIADGGPLVLQQAAQTMR